MDSCIYRGRVRHRRFQPVPHEFSYRLFMMYLDLGELETLPGCSWIWPQRNRWAPLVFRREDYLGAAEVPLREAIARRVREETGSVPDGPIRMLTHLRTFGYCFNPVTFYYCFDRTGSRVRTVVAEITNTPWKDRHSYVLQVPETARRGPFRFRKAFHVSPFLDMGYDYEWILPDPGRRLIVHMRNLKENRCDFEATLTMQKEVLSARNLRSLLLNFPLMTTRIAAAIHWQAFRLWMKDAPFFSHPDPDKRKFEGLR